MARFGSIGSIQFTGLGKSGRRPPLGILVAMPESSTGSFNPYTSNDNGATWIQRTNPRTAGTVTSYFQEVLNLGNGSIFALAYDYDTSFGPFDVYVSGYLTSTNGTTWTNAGTFPRSEIPSGQTRWNLYTKAAHNGRGTIVLMGFESGSGGASSYCKVSTDYGVNWTTVNFGNSLKYSQATNQQPLQYVNNQFVYLCKRAGTSPELVYFLTSPDGLTWTVKTPNLGNVYDTNNLSSFIFDTVNNRYVATRGPNYTSGALLSNLSAYSSDLVTWTATTTVNYYMPVITYGNGRSVVQGYYIQTITNANGDQVDQVQAIRTVDYSTNGTSWSATGSVLPTALGQGGVGQQGAYSKLEFAGGYFWGFGATTNLSGDAVVLTTPTWLARSTDGLTWTKLNGPNTTGLYDAKIRYI